MKQFLTLTLTLLLTLSLNAFAARPQQRVVHLDSLVNCSAEHFQQVVDKFFYQFQTNSDSLFSWVYLNTGGDGNDKDDNGKDAVALRYAGATYDPITRTGDQTFDIYVLGSKMFPNRHLVTVNHGNYMVATYSGSLLNDANIRFQMDSIAPAQTNVHYEFNLEFGRFFAMFVSDKVWHNTIRWRLEQVFKNLIEYAETGTVTEIVKDEE